MYAFSFSHIRIQVQAGWDIFRDEEADGAINCPRCGQLYIPMLAYKQFSIEEALTLSDAPNTRKPDSRHSAFADQLPPQIGPEVEKADASHVRYISPASLRLSLERQIEDQGEAVLEREKLEALHPELFYNLWWYSAREFLLCLLLCI